MGVWPKEQEADQCWHDRNPQRVIKYLWARLWQVRLMKTASLSCLRLLLQSLLAHPSLSLNTSSSCLPGRKRIITRFDGFCISKIASANFLPYFPVHVPSSLPQGKAPRMAHTALEMLWVQLLCGSWPHST